MVLNYFKIAWRNLKRYRSFSLINILGLAIGMASFVLIALWMKHEITYDLFHEKKDRIYQVWNRSENQGKVGAWNATPQPLAAALLHDFGDIEHAVRVDWPQEYEVAFEAKKLKGNGVFVDSSFLDVFTFPMVSGNARAALSDRHSIVITERMAAKIFGKDDPMGRTIRIADQDNFTVAGVLKDLPDNTRFDFDFIIPWSYLKHIGAENDYWSNNATSTYVLLKEQADLEALKTGLKQVRKRYDKKSPNDEMFLYPISRWRLYSSFKNGVEEGGIIDYLRMMGVLAGFVLLIACINFMNLSTARSQSRAREIGVRKVIGAGKASLVWQFIGESLLLSLAAGILALLFVQGSIGAFGELTGKVLQIDLANPVYWFWGVVLVLFTGLLAGAYPAFFLSAFRPVAVLKGARQAGAKGELPRKALVVFQFFIAIVLIVSTMVVRQQIAYASDRHAGYEKKNLLYINLTDSKNKHFNTIKNELIASGAVTSLTRTSAPITERWSNSAMFEWSGRPEGDRTVIERILADDAVGKTIGLEFIDGRDFDLTQFSTDSTAMILNESAAKLMGFADPIGQVVRDNQIDWHVIGVVKDFILESPYRPIAPLAIEGAKNWFNVAHIRLNESRPVAENVASIEKILRAHDPETPFEYRFIDEEYDRKFQSEKRTATITSLFSGLTIFISCLGLFGLAAYMTENRVKEIGIRRVLGASIRSIVAMLSKDFLVLVVIALVIAVPVAWWLVNAWLEGYPYRVEIRWWVFLVAGFGAILLAFLTVGLQSVKAGKANPVKSLRSE